MAYFTKEVNWSLAKPQLKFNGGLAKLRLTSLVKKARSTLALVYWYTDIDVPRAHFCLLLGVSSGCVWPIAGQVTSVAWPVIGWAQTELTLRKRQKMGPDSIIVLLWCFMSVFLNKSVHGHLIFITQRIIIMIMSYRKWKKKLSLNF